VNAGRDVERLIASWLVEESPGRAPDRILEVAAQTIDRTKQRRFAAAWREPVNISMRGLAAMAAVVLVAVIGAGVIGRSTANVGTPASSAPTSSPTPTAAGVTLAQYKTARDAICAPAITHVIALNDAGANLHPDTTPADVPAAIANLQQIIAVGNATVDKLAALDPPVAMAADHAADVTHHRDGLSILEEAVAKLQANDPVAAMAIADATGAISALEEGYEQAYGLSGCP
jgi:hypothetical protein